MRKLGCLVRALVVVCLVSGFSMTCFAEQQNLPATVNVPDKVLEKDEHTLLLEHFESKLGVETNGGRFNEGEILFGPGKFGNAYFCQGLGPYYSVSQCFNPDAGTIEAWVKPVDWKMQGEDAHVLFSIFLNWGSPLLILKRFWGALEVRLVDNDQDSFVVKGGKNWGNDEWHHVVLLWEKEKGIALYTDGVFQELAEGPYDFSPTATSLSIGVGPWGPKMGASAVIDELRISNIWRPEYSQSVDVEKF